MLVNRKQRSEVGKNKKRTFRLGKNVRQLYTSHAQRITPTAVVPHQRKDYSLRPLTEYMATKYIVTRAFAQTTCIDFPSWFGLRAYSLRGGVWRSEVSA